LDVESSRVMSSRQRRGFVGKKREAGYRSLKTALLSEIHRRDDR
jgi:hypothetical protein